MCVSMYVHVLALVCVSVSVFDIKLDFYQNTCPLCETFNDLDTLRDKPQSKALLVLSFKSQKV